jgi:uncharacterized protein
MRRAYFDASAIVKLSREEAHSQSLIDYLDDGPLEVSTSVVAEVEVAVALRRVAADFADAVTGFYLVALDEDVRKLASQLRVPLRALDAIHVGTALAIADRDLEFVTYDDRMAAAAHDAGLRVVRPGC